MTSWGHPLKSLSPEEQVEGLPGRRYRRCCGTCHRKPALRHGEESAAKYESRLMYVTGKAGRATDRRQVLCERHAAEFAGKHKLELPASTLAAEDVPVGWNWWNVAPAERGKE